MSPGARATAGTRCRAALDPPQPAIVPTASTIATACAHRTMAPTLATRSSMRRSAPGRRPRGAARRSGGVCHTRCSEDLSAGGALLVLAAVLVMAARRSGNGLPLKAAIEGEYG